MHNFEKSNIPKIELSNPYIIGAGGFSTVVAVPFSKLAGKMFHVENQVGDERSADLRNPNKFAVVKVFGFFDEVDQKQLDFYQSSYQVTLSAWAYRTGRDGISKRDLTWVYCDQEMKQMLALRDIEGVPEVYGMVEVKVGDNVYPGIAMEVVQGMPLDDIETFKSLTVDDRIKIVKELGRIVSEINARRVMLGDDSVPIKFNDLKLSNILVRFDENGDLLGLTLVDYGLCTGVSEDQMVAITPMYHSKEAQKKGLFTMEDQVFSYFAVAFTIMFGVPPFAEGSSSERDCFDLRSRLCDNGYFKQFLDAGYFKNEFYGELIKYFNLVFNEGVVKVEDVLAYNQSGVYIPNSVAEAKEILEKLLMRRGLGFGRGY